MFTATGRLTMCVGKLSTCTASAVTVPPNPPGPTPDPFTSSSRSSSSFASVGFGAGAGRKHGEGHEGQANGATRGPHAAPAQRIEGRTVPDPADEHRQLRIRRTGAGDPCRVASG